MAVKRKAEGAKAWGAWEGDLEALDRLIDRLQDLTDNAYMEQRADLDRQLEELRAEREKSLQEIGDLRERIGDENAKEIDEMRKSRFESIQQRLEDESREWMVVMTAAEKELSLEERAEAKLLLPTLDPRRVEGVKLRVGEWLTGAFRVEIDLFRLAGCSLKVQGEDARMVRTALEELSSELRSGVPWWQWLRREGIWWAWLLLGGISGVLLAISLSQGAGKDDRTSAVTAGLYLGVGAGLGFFWLARRVLPGFDLHASGAPSKGHRALGIIAAWLAFVVSVVLALTTVD